jgi:CheY-like chemotaxis protein
VVLGRFTAPAPGVPVDLGAGEYLCLLVEDNGHGMDEATQKRIFEPFFTTKGPGEGTGLGLSVVHGLVRDHEGLITVESAPDRGTRFVIYLPVADPAELDPAVVNDETPAGQGERILFVDDEPALCESAARLLTRLGYRPEVFTRSEEAWLAIAREPYAWDLVLTDLTMPALSGDELARRVHQLRPSLPIVLASGYSGMLTPDAITRLGIREVVQKPLSQRELARVVHRALRPNPSVVGPG